jgi:phosphate transport system permease protein
MSPKSQLAYSLRKQLLDDLPERLIGLALFCCAFVSVLTTTGIIGIIFGETLQFFKRVSLAQFFLDTQWTPLFANPHFGIWPLINGTFMITMIAILVALPLGLSSAIYLSEYATPKVAAVLRPAMELLAGVPTVVYGYFALLVVTPALGRFLPVETFNVLSAGLMMGIMITPTVGSISLDVIRAVPCSLREGSFALGVTKHETIFMVVLPAALSGIVASLILAISRAVGETMITVIAAGSQPNISFNPLQSLATLTAFMAEISSGDSPRGSLSYQTLYAVGAVLFVLTLALNLVSFWISRIFKESHD